MKTPKQSFLALAFMGALAGAAIGLAQPDKTKPAVQPGRPPAPGKPEGGPPGMDDKMKEMQEAMQTGPEHAALMKLAGDYDVTTTMEGAGQPPMTTKESASLKTALGGRFIHESGQGEIMGAPVDNFKMFGYNSGRKRYEASWGWTMNTSILSLVGESKDGGKTIDMNASYYSKPDKREEFKVTYTFTDADHFTVKIHGGKMPDGAPGPVMTSVYTRKK